MECAIWGSSEMSQIHTQWSHFSRLLVTVDFDDSSNTKVWSVILNRPYNARIFVILPVFL